MPVEPSQPFLECPACARAALFEQPPCADGHGADCPEWFCSACGAAVFRGPVAATPAGVVVTERRAA